MSQPQQQSSGFQFGGNTNQSFPPPAQSQSFQFSVPGASSSFTFGSSENTQTQSVSNPFANVNGVNGGFGGQQVVNTDMQDSTQQAQPVQPPQSSSVFNFAASQPAQSANTNGFNFGSTTTQQSNGGFGAGLFGQQNTQNQNSGTSLFGQSSNGQQNGFTPSFGQNNKESPSSSIFSQPTTTTAPPFSGFGNNSPAATASAPPFSFGSPSVAPTSQAQSTETSSKPASLFNFASSKAESMSAEKKPTFSFGTTATPSTNSENQSTPKPQFTGFDRLSNEQAPAPTNNSIPFAGFGTPSKSPEPSSVQQPFPLFGQSASSTERKSSLDASDSDQADKTDQANQGPKNPFSSLFAPTSTTSPTSKETPKPAKTPFQFGQSTSFAPASTTSTPAKSTDLVPSAKSSATDLSGAPAENLFSPKPTASSSTVAGGLFNLNKSNTASQDTTSSDSDRTPSKPFQPAFNFTPQKPAETSVAPPPSLFSFGNQQPGSSAAKNSSTTVNDDAASPKKSLFQGGATPETMAKSALGSSGSSATTVTDSVKSQSTAQTRPVSQPTTTRAVSTEGPPQIPRFLGGDKYKSYDESWRLKSLNRSFKTAITALDPDMHDFMNIVQNYLDHREAIGEGLAGYQRHKLVGSKRKVNDVDDLQDEDSTTKRPKPINASSQIEPASTAPKSFPPAQSGTSSMFSANTAPKATTGFTPVKTVADTQTSNVFKSMIPGAANNASASTGATSFAPAKSTTPPTSPPKALAPQMPKFELPKFAASGTSFMSAFAKNSAASSKKLEQEAKEKRKAEEFDSDEDDEEEWDRKYEEEQKAKKAKIEAAAKGTLAVPSFIASASSSRSNSPFAWNQPVKSIETNGSKSPEPSQQDVGSSASNAIDIESGEDSTGQESGNSGDDEAEQIEEDDQHEEDEQNDDEEDEAEEIPDIAPEDSLFSRITGKASTNRADPAIMQPAANSSFKPGLMFGNIGKSTPPQPTFSPVTPVGTSAMPKGDFVPTTKFNFNPGPSTSSNPIFGSSVLKDGPIPGEGLFGSRPSTPSNNEPSKPFSGFSTSKQPADNTYKQGSPIKFGNSTSAPSVEVTAATPPAKETPKPFASLFGQSTSNATSSNGASLGFSFGTSTNGGQPAPGFLSAASHIGGTSGISSRATSPGVTSEAESVATDNTEDYSQEPQTSLISSNSGEENENVLYETKAKISRLFKESEVPEKSKYTVGWNTMGSGIVRLLKDKTSGKTRIVFRAEPNANVILNTRLLASLHYKTQPAGKQGAVTFPVATDKGLQMWMIRVKSPESAGEAARLMEANKKN